MSKVASLIVLNLLKLVDSLHWQTQMEIKVMAINYIHWKWDILRARVVTAGYTYRWMEGLYLRCITNSFTISISFHIGSDKIGLNVWFVSVECWQGSHNTR